MSNVTSTWKTKLGLLNFDHPKSVLEDTLVVSKPTKENFNSFFREDNKELYLLVEAKPDVKYVGFDKATYSKVEREIKEQDTIIFLNPETKQYDILNPVEGLDVTRFQAYALSPETFIAGRGYQPINLDYKHWLFLDTKHLKDYEQVNEELFCIFRNCQEIKLNISDLAKLIGYKFVEFYGKILLINPHSSSSRIAKNAISFTSFCNPIDEVKYEDFENFLDNHFIFNKTHEKYTTEFISDHEILIKRKYRVIPYMDGKGEYTINPLPTNQGVFLLSANEFLETLRNARKEYREQSQGSIAKQPKAGSTHVHSGTEVTPSDSE